MVLDAALPGRWAARFGLGLLLCLSSQPADAGARDWQHPGRNDLQITGGLHYAFLPDRLLDLFYAEHASLIGAGPGLGLAWVKEGFRAQLAFSTVFVTTPDSIWLEKGASKADAEWVEVDMTLLDLSARFAYAFPVGHRLSLIPHLGWGPLWNVGQVLSHPTIGDPALPLEERSPDMDAQGKILRLPRRFLRSDLGLHATWALTERLELQTGLSWHLLLSADVGLSWRTHFNRSHSA